MLRRGLAATASVNQGLSRSIRRSLSQRHSVIVATAGIARPLHRRDHRPFSNLAPSDEKHTITQLLYALGARKEVEYYLRHFSAVSRPQFAIVKVGGALLSPTHLQVLASSLAFLAKVGLYPIIVHGAGPQLNAELEEAGIEPTYIDGIRVTDPATLCIARRIFLDENLRLVDALEMAGVKARPVAAGVFFGNYLDREKYDLVGEINRVDVGPVDSAVRVGAIPVLSSLAETDSGQVLNVNADIAAAQLARAVRPLKIVYLNDKGGLFHGGTGDLTTT